MKTLGVIIEYNPMHLGHVHHLEQAKRITNADLVIGVMSPNFVQRGQPAIVSKFKRTQTALESGIDIVCELPTFYALQAAQYFAYKTVSILNLMEVDTIVFGSEKNDMQALKDIATLPIDLEKFRNQLDSGKSYATSFDFTVSPNDILGISYLREIMKTTIQPYTIQRTNSYFDNRETQFYSAHDIRHHLNEPEYSRQSLVDLSQIAHLDKMFEFLRYKLISSSSQQLEKVFLVNEGIQNLLKEKILLATSFEHFISLCTSKRYSASRISRICMHILLNSQKQSEKNYKVRILGARKHALPYLKNKNVGTRIGDFESHQIQPEILATQIYSLFSDEKNLPNQEISKLIIHP